MASAMPDIDLEALDDYLLSGMSPDSMLLPGLDGFLTGIIVGPESIPVSEWMPIIWGGEEPEFASERHKRTILATIMELYQEIIATLNSDPDNLAPIFSRGPEDEWIITDWAAGFLEAIKLRRTTWEPLFKHPRAKILLFPLVTLGDDEDFFEYHPSHREKEVYASEPDLLLDSVIGVYEFWQDHRPDRRKAYPRRKRGSR